MDQPLSKEELIALVSKLMRAEGTGRERNEWLKLLERNVPDPDMSDLIYWPKREMTAEEIVETALAYEPIRLPPRSDRQSN